MEATPGKKTSGRVTSYQQRMQNEAKYKLFAQQLSAIILTRCVILGPIERMKIILQVNPLANFAKPSDRPKNAIDLSNKISINQGLVAYYRGVNALIYKLSISHLLKFTLYETLFNQLQHSPTNHPNFFACLGAASATALLTTAITYPFDLAHGRMSADMSKKTSVVVQSKNASPLQAKPTKLYSSVRDCLTKTQEQSGVLQSKKFTNMFRGIQSALMGQVPYTVVLMSSFEAFNHFLDSQNTKFSKRDDHSFIYKFLVRFGASSFSLLIAQGLCYPLDTVKRRMQLNGSQGYKNLYKTDMHCLQRIWKEEGARGLYAGWTVNMVRCLPMALIQFIMFQNLRFITKEQKGVNKKQQLKE